MNKHYRKATIEDCLLGSEVWYFENEEFKSGRISQEHRALKLSFIVAIFDPTPKKIQKHYEELYVVETKVNITVDMLSGDLARFYHALNEDKGLEHMLFDFLCEEFDKRMCLENNLSNTEADKLEFSDTENYRRWLESTIEEAQAK